MTRVESPSPVGSVDPVIRPPTDWFTLVGRGETSPSREIDGLYPDGLREPAWFLGPSARRPSPPTGDLVWRRTPEGDVGGALFRAPYPTACHKPPRLSR